MKSDIFSGEEYFCDRSCQFDIINKDETRTSRIAGAFQL
jgi:hypothetical protein